MAATKLSNGYKYSRTTETGRVARVIGGMEPLEPTRRSTQGVTTVEHASSIWSIPALSSSASVEAKASPAAAIASDASSAATETSSA